MRSQSWLCIMPNADIQVGWTSQQIPGIWSIPMWRKRWSCMKLFHLILGFFQSKRDILVLGELFESRRIHIEELGKLETCVRSVQEMRHFVRYPCSGRERWCGRTCSQMLWHVCILWAGSTTVFVGLGTYRGGDSEAKDLKEGDPSLRAGHSLNGDARDAQVAGWGPEIGVTKYLLKKLRIPHFLPDLRQLSSSCGWWRRIRL